MSRFKPIGYNTLARKLQRAGYIPIRKNKHTIYFNPIKEITIPVPHKHPKDISQGLLHKLVKEMGLMAEEFNKL